jgi:hypothetical protein
MVQAMQDDFGEPASLGGQGFYLGPVDAYQRIFRGDEKGIDDHQHTNQEQPPHDR